MGAVYQFDSGRVRGTRTRLAQETRLEPCCRQALADVVVKLEELYTLNPHGADFVADLADEMLRRARSRETRQSR